MALPSARVYRGVRLLDSPPIVTHDSAHPDTLSSRLSTDTGIFDFKMDATQADVLHYRLGRALHPEETPTKSPSDFL